MRFKAFQYEILGLFLENDQIGKIDYRNFETQHSLPNNMGIPDLVIHNDEFEILFEFKTCNTDLTKNQPDGYLEYLIALDEINPKVTKWLIFILPEKYKHRKQVEDRIIQKDPEKKINIKIITWQIIIKHIKDSQLSELNHSIKEFLILMKTWFEYKSISFDPAEVKLLFSEVKVMLNEEVIPAIIEKLFKLVDDVKDQLTKIASVKAEKDYGGYGYYIKNENGEEIFWFGIWYRLWKEHQKPFCFGVSDEWNNIIKNKFFHMCPETIKFDNIWNMSWIDQDILSKGDRVESIANRFEEIIKKLLEKEESDLAQS